MRISILKFTTSKIVNSGSYLGGRKNDWLPESEKFTLGYKSTVTLFNTSISSFFFIRAKSFLEQAISQGGRGFFFGLIAVKNMPNISMKKLASLNQIVSDGNWRGGYVTNTKSFRTRLANGSKKFSFVVSFRFDYPSFPIIFETRRIKLPLISPVDSNSNPSYFSYPIPGNSSGAGVLQFLSDEFTASVFSGMFKRYKIPNVFKLRNPMNARFSSSRFNNNRKNFSNLH